MWAKPRRSQCRMLHFTSCALTSPGERRAPSPCFRRPVRRPSRGIPVHRDVLRRARVRLSPSVLFGVFFHARAHPGRHRLGMGRSRLLHTVAGNGRSAPDKGNARPHFEPGQSSVGACRGFAQAGPENALGGSGVRGQDQATLHAVSLENPCPRQKGQKRSGKILQQVVA